MTLNRNEWRPCSSSLFWRDGRIGEGYLRLLDSSGRSLGASLSLQLAFLEFRELLLMLLESIVALGHMAFRHGTGARTVPSEG